MYEIRKDGGVIALAEAPNYIRRHADGFYILCEEKDAQGVAVDGTAYCLMGRTGLDELEEVQIVERDAGTIILQQGKDATPAASRSRWAQRSARSGSETPWAAATGRSITFR